MFALDILIFALIAAFFFFKYRGVMGQPPAEPKNPGDVQKPKNRPIIIKQQTKQEIPTISSADGPVSINVQLNELSYVDPQFNEKDFLSGAKAAFEMILTAYAKGDKTTLESLLSPTVYNGFVSAINARKEAGHTIEFELEKITDADIIKIQQNPDDKGKHHFTSITVEFKSEQTTATYDTDGNLIDGDKNLIITPIDRWTFERDMRSNKPDWVLTATESVA